MLRFIEVHLSDPQLSTAMVAKGCGIRPRYLSFLLRLKGTSFSELVWEQRLEKAKYWLSASDPRDISISEIAYGVGFKSPAHFSRMFKRVFKVNPREFRGECTEHAGHLERGTMPSATSPWVCCSSLLRSNRGAAYPRAGSKYGLSPTTVTRSIARIAG